VKNSSARQSSYSQLWKRGQKHINPEFCFDDITSEERLFQLLARGMENTWSLITDSCQWYRSKQITTFGSQQ